MQYTGLSYTSLICYDITEVLTVLSWHLHSHSCVCLSSVAQTSISPSCSTVQNWSTLVENSRVFAIKTLIKYWSWEAAGPQLTSTWSAEFWKSQLQSQALYCVKAGIFLSGLRLCQKQSSVNADDKYWKNLGCRFL